MNVWKETFLACFWCVASPGLGPSFVTSAVASLGSSQSSPPRPFASSLACLPTARMLAAYDATCRAMTLKSSPSVRSSRRSTQGFCWLNENLIHGVKVVRDVRDFDCALMEWLPYVHGATHVSAAVALLTRWWRGLRHAVS